MDGAVPKKLFFPLFWVLVATTTQSFAACHAAGPSATGNGSGSSWSNVMTLPTAPVRGDTYYLRDGGYGTYSPTTATSGTTRITIKKAQSYDYGRASDGCSNDISAGWNTATMGSSQAIFSGSGGVLSTSGGQGYYTFDGNGKTPGVACGASPAVSGGVASDCGIKFAASSTSGSTYGIIWINSTYDNGATRAVGWIIRYTEVVGAGDASNQVTNSNEHTLYCRNGCDTFLFEHNYLHDCGSDCIDDPWGNGNTFNLNHFRHNALPNSTHHGQFFLGDGSGNGGFTNFTFSNNIIEDMGGTALWACLNGGACSNFYIYNNIILSPTNTQNHFDDGIFSVINSGSTGSNINLYDNSWINVHVNYSGAFAFNCETTCTGLTFQNNLLYQIIDNQNGTNPIGGCGFTSGCVTNHNSYINVAGSIGMSGTADVQMTSNSPSPFINWASYSFNLASQSNNWDNGISLASPYNVDAAGNPRPSNTQWDRGAYEYGATQAQAPNPPTGLVATVH
jgi:hypothetical protein